MLLRLGRQIGRTTRFPPPDGYFHWDNGAVEDLICGMFEAKPQFLVGCLVLAHDDQSLERLLLTALKNWLIDQAKATEVGKLRRRLDNVLGKDPRFVKVKAGQDRWALAGRAETEWQGDTIRLHAAAHRVRGVQITQWNTAGPTPQDTKDKLTLLTQEVLAEAGGSVSAQDLARVLAARFQLEPSPTFVPLSAAAKSAPGRSVGPTSSALVGAAARNLWESLSADEQAAVPLLAADPDEIAARIQTGRETAATVQAAVREKLRLATVDDEDAETVIVELLRLAANPAHVTSSEIDKGVEAHPVRQDAMS